MLPLSCAEPLGSEPVRVPGPGQPVPRLVPGGLGGCGGMAGYERAAWPSCGMRLGCAGPCALRGAQEFADELCKELGVETHQTTEDGLFEVEEVMCLAACDKAPMFQLQRPEGISYHEDQTVESAMALVESIRNEA